MPTHKQELTYAPRLNAPRKSVPFPLNLPELVRRD